MCFPFSPRRRETHKQFDPHPFPGQSREVVYVYCFFSAVNKRGRPSKWLPECLPSKFADFECAFPYNSLEKIWLPKTPFWRGLSGTNPGGRFAPGRFCSLPIFFCTISGESHRPLTPILLKSIAIHLRFLSRYFRKSMAESSIYTTNLYHDTPPICITILLQKY